MRNLLSLTFALLLVAGSLGLADAHGRKGSHRYGGLNSHGKGSHYVGGSYGGGRQPREHHPRKLKSCTERYPCIKVKCPDDPADPNYYLPTCVDHRVVAPVIIAPTTHAAPVVARVAPHPPIVAPHPPVVAPIPQPAPVDAWTILAIILTVATFAMAAFLAFLLLRALAALAKYIAGIPMRLLRARDALAKYIAGIPMRLLRALAALAKYIARIPIRWIAGRMRARSLRSRHTRRNPARPGRRALPGRDRAAGGTS
jgi:hypothetical protein